MIVTFKVSDFAEAAKAIRNIPGSARSVDMLDHARIERKGATLSLTMSDMDIEACATIDCEQGAACLAAIPSAILEFFIARTGAGDQPGTLDFDEDMRNVIARHGKARLSMPILRGEDFYLLQCTDPTWSLKLLAHEFSALLKRCERALGNVNPHRPMLDGPFLHTAGGQLKIIATDGFRVHLFDFDGVEVTGELPARLESLPGVIMPPKSVKEFLRIFSGDESEITISGNDRTMVIAGERLTIASKLIDAAYIDYPRFIPAIQDAKISASTDALIRALDGLMVVPKTDAKGKKLPSRVIRLTVGEASIDMTTSGDVGDAEDSLDAENEGIAPGTYFQFDARYLRDAVDAAGVKRISLHEAGEGGQFFHLSGAEGATFLIGQRQK